MDEEHQVPADAAEGAQAGSGAPSAGPAGPRPRASLGAWLQSRGARWGTATAAYVVVVAAVLVAVNLVGARIGTTWDLTQGHQLTLSPASRSIAAHVTRPVRIIAFTQPGDPTGDEIATLLRQYARYSHGRITYQVVDPVTDSALAERYGVQAYNTVVVQSGTNVQVVQPSDMTTYNAAGNPVFSGENAITNAILRAGAPVTLRVVWLAGDGEPDITQGRRPGAVQGLQDTGYQVGTLNLLTSRGVPGDVAAVVIDSPTRDLSPGEVAALRAYAARGGHFVVLLPPTLQPLPNLDALLASWGIVPQNDVVIDLARHYQADPTAVVPRYASSPITQPLQQANLAVLLPAAQGLTLKTDLKGYAVAPVLETTAGSRGGQPLSWGMTDIPALLKGTIAYTPHRDIPGPVVLAATSSASPAPPRPAVLPPSGAPGFRAVVIGDSAFVSSGTLTGGGSLIAVQGNRDLFLNAVGWATGQTQGITVRPNPTLSTQLFVTAATERSLALGFLVAVPLVCFLLAVGTWLSRRRL
jgi:ABC-2 type transport system permease protein